MSEAKAKLGLAVALPPVLLDLVAGWFSLWGLPGFEQHIAINFSTRLQRALGRCYAKRRRIHVAARLKEKHPSLLAEVLCHECAHLAVFTLHCDGCRPHGAEWARLMRMAGFEPQRCLVLNESGVKKPNDRCRYRYVHACPICQTERVGRRPVRSWRCTGCMALGLEGLLEIRKLTAGQGTGR